MSAFDIRPVTARTLDALAWALERLAEDLEDDYRAAPETLAAACFGPSAACRGLIARRGGDTIGAALMSPVFSTSYGTTGVYVSDLWVDARARGTGLGKALLGAASRLGRDTWQAGFVKLTVYEDNAEAASFYDRLGFATAERDRARLLSGAPYRSLMETTA